MEGLRQEYVERVGGLEFKLQEKNQLIQQFQSTLESRIEGQLQALKAKFNQKLEQKSELAELHSLKADVRVQLEKTNEVI